MRSPRLSNLVPLLLVAGSIVAVACSAASGDNGFGDEDDDGSGAASGSGGSGGSLFPSTGSGTDGGVLGSEPNCDGVDPAIDNDGDGWTGAAGDCNDCTPLMNPGAMDYPGNNIDEDCNQAKDDNPGACDTGLALNSADPRDGARAMGICKDQVGESWGLVNAEYVTADGQPLSNYDFEGIGHGILDRFGPNLMPLEGVKVLALSSGAARQPTDPGYMSPQGYDKFYSTGAPPGYPKESPSCPGVITGEPYDSAGLRVTLRTPTNAKSLRFNLDFYTYEFPIYICSEYNDFFVALLNPVLPNLPDGNISFDSQGNSISVNAGFLEVCTPQTAGGKDFPCALGPTQLSGTGFEGSAATGWLQTTAPIENPGGDITLHFTIWDSGDGVLDSTVLLDSFAFEAEETPTETTPVDPPE